MKLSRTFILLVALAPLTFGASKEIVELQRDVAMLQDQVRNVQKSLDEKVTTIQIEGGGQLHGAEHTLWGDYIEAGSWAVVAAVTGGEIEVRGARAEDMEVVSSVLKLPVISPRS